MEAIATEAERVEGVGMQSRWARHGRDWGLDMIQTLGRERGREEDEEE